VRWPPNLRGSALSSGEGRHTPETAVVEERLQVRLLGSVEAPGQPAHSPYAHRVSTMLPGYPSGYRSRITKRLGAREHVQRARRTDCRQTARSSSAHGRESFLRIYGRYRAMAKSEVPLTSENPVATIFPSDWMARA
jgi:hypothetical protein